MKMLIIADDFTGAVDTGVQLAKRSVKTLVTVGPDFPSGSIGACEALAVNMDMRHDGPEQAYHKVESLLERFDEDILIYLKTDSVLRGNLSASFYALLKAGRGPVLFAPAYPKSARTTVNGRQYVNGLPLEESHFSRDPLNPTLNSDIATLLSDGFAVESVVLGGDNLLPDYLDPGKVYIFDCETQDRLCRIAYDISKRKTVYALAGCAGFAEYIPDIIPFATQLVHYRANEKPVLFLSGSASETTFQQLAYAKENGFPILVIPSELKISPPELLGEKLVGLLGMLRAWLESGISVILATAESDKDLLTDAGPEVHANLKAIFAQTAQAMIECGAAGNLAVFGGDTAQAVLSYVGCRAVQALYEVQAGVPLCKLDNDGGDADIGLVTKSGGLGGEDAVTAVEKALRCGVINNEERI
ncbi:MAG: hypothetical protein LBV27_02165 [Oscillospiraceae bacterium]|jgi:uncharacterized protein YgbK (DUF1537 family)|nr:hypothetical protein [Oscillospiraceae bacterium]